MNDSKCYFDSRTFSTKYSNLMIGAPADSKHDSVSDKMVSKKKVGLKMDRVQFLKLLKLIMICVVILLKFEIKECNYNKLPKAD